MSVVFYAAANCMSHSKITSREDWFCSQTPQGPHAPQDPQAHQAHQTNEAKILEPGATNVKKKTFNLKILRLSF